MYKSVHVRVVHDSRYVVMRSNDSFNFPLGLIKYIVIIVIVNTGCTNDRRRNWCHCGFACTFKFKCSVLHVQVN